MEKLKCNTLNTPLCIARCIAADRTPANRGEVNQLATIVSSPGYPQCTHAVPAPATVMPSTAPTMACVVETGIAKNVANSMNKAPESRAQAIPAVQGHEPLVTKSQRKVSVTSFGIVH